MDNAVKKTVVLGASPNPTRYAYSAVQRLQAHGHEAVPVGLRDGQIGDTPILTGQPDVAGVDTVTLYVGPQNQAAYYDYVLGLRPRRLIFNPGTENPELMRLAQAQGIEVEAACTLVLLALGAY